MKIYAVGGAVRDELLGLAVKDRDYVVVGATPAEMERRGFKPVGRDFPVFLHPQTHEEYALARTERKTAPGYKGFTVHASPEVTLEEDLARRDLTINAIARDASGALIDPYGGERDLRAGILRHVSAAFVEDPVRLLRVARFAARFGFTIAPETQALLRAMVDAGEVDALVAERVWQEVARGLMEARPLAMLDVLETCGAITRILPEWSSVDHTVARAALERAAARRATLAIRYALLFAGAPAQVVEAASDRLRAPSECRELAILIARHGSAALRASGLAPAALVDLLREVDAFRRRDRFSEFLAACSLLAAASGVAGFTPARLEQALAAAAAVDAAAVARSAPGNVAPALRAARIAAVERALGQCGP